jgi:putative PIN family toxin of toxin-antitoxin system
MSPSYTAAPKVVFDCNVFLQALVNPRGPSGRCKQLVDSGEIELFISGQVMDEVAEVLSRPRVRQLAPALTLEVIAAFIEDLWLKAICLHNVPEEYHFERDPKDARYINLALIAGASYLVSRDKDLLDLTEKTTDLARDFQRRFPLLRVIRPQDLLIAISGQS